MNSLEHVRRELEAYRAVLSHGADFRRRLELGRSLGELDEGCRAKGPKARELRAEIAELVRNLAERNRTEVDEVVTAIASGELRGTRLVEMLAGLSDHPLDATRPHFGDEPLDHYLEELLGTHRRFDGGAPPGEEMIHYDPSPASATLALARLSWFDPGEVFVDVGSGTGRVTVLAALLGEARCVGVEIDASLAQVSIAAARRLGASNIEVRIGDARTVPLEDGTAFFFFAPFVGSVLDEVLSRLEAIARQRPIRVGSWGPSTQRIAQAPFLVPDHDPPYGPFDLATFRSERPA